MCFGAFIWSICQDHVGLNGPDGSFRYPVDEFEMAGEMALVLPVESPAALNTVFLSDSAIMDGISY